MDDPGSRTPTSAPKRRRVDESGGGDANARPRSHGDAFGGAGRGGRGAGRGAPGGGRGGGRGGRGGGGGVREFRPQAHDHSMEAQSHAHTGAQPQMQRAPVAAPAQRAPAEAVRAQGGNPAHDERTTDSPSAPPKRRRNRRRGKRADGTGDAMEVDGDEGEDGEVDGDGDVAMAPADGAAGPSAPAPRGATATGTSGTSSIHLTTTTFASLPISPLSVRALETVLGYRFLTEVQLATLPHIMQGRDVLARARTGTGKTLGFLIPSVERLLASPPARGDIAVLVLSPTRELATQIATEAAALLKFHSFGVQCVYGGTNIATERRKMNSERCDILVATPGRLTDHLENTEGLRGRLSRLKVLVLDEADQLLEMGFRPAIERILSLLPNGTATGRQTLLFSATIPQQLHQVAGLCMRTDRQFVDTVGEESVHTNEQVVQSYAVVPFETQIHAVMELVQAERRDPGHKIICFFTTARLTQFMAELFNAAAIPVLEIHSRKSQAQRTKVSDAFRSSAQAILFTSDVSARGIDYPDVTLVLQVGIPSDREQYIHRVGRTARAGKIGRGVLVLAPFERFFLRHIADLPVTEAPPITVTPQTTAAVANALQRLSPVVKGMAYQAWLGFYNSSRGTGWDKPTLVQMANHFAALIGCDSPPPLLAKTIGKMGLKGVPGLVVDRGQAGWGGDGGRGGGGGGRGQGHGGGRGGRGGGAGMR